MNTTGQKGEKAGYKAVLLLAVGLTAFSSAMKELNELQQFALNASRLAEHWSAKFAPAPVPQIPQLTEIERTEINVETCDLKQSLPSVELPWLSNAPVQANHTKPRAVVPRPSQVIDFKNDLPQPGEIQIAKLKKLPQIDIDPVQFAFRIANDAEAQALVVSELPVTPVKIKTRKQREIRINPRDCEIHLKSLNRSINLRFAS